MPNAPLAPYRVLDLTDANGWSCARILADLGADVIKIEPPHGDPGRDQELHWLAYNANKRGITLNLASDPGRDIFHRLAQNADFIVLSDSRGSRDSNDLVADPKNFAELTSNSAGLASLDAPQKNRHEGVPTPQNNSVGLASLDAADRRHEGVPTPQNNSVGLASLDAADKRHVGVATPLTYDALLKLNPRVIVTTITPFGTTGPYAQYRGSDLTATAASGFMSLVGEPDRAPLRVSLPQSPLWAGMYAAAGTLIAHYQRERTGRGQHVDTSMQASMLWALATAPTYWSLNRENLSRGGNFVVGRSITGARMRALYPCKDGHINFIIYGGEAGKRSNEAMVEWMAETGRAPEHLKQKDWGAFNVATSQQAEIDSIEKPFMEFLRDKTKAEFSTESVKRGIMGYPVANAQDIRSDPQLAARDFWQAVPHDGVPITFSGAFAKFSATQVSVRRPAPKLGEHNEEIFVGELGMGVDVLKRDGVV